jgi:chaperonin GroEL (HSP60 family)
VSKGKLSVDNIFIILFANRYVLLLQYFVEAGAMAVRRCKKADLKRIAKATGATLLSSMANLEGISLLLRLFFSTKTI